MESIELKALPVTAAIKLPPPTHAGKSIITMTNVNLGYGERTILKKIDFTLLNGDHLAVVGLNGAGKSTFLKALAQRLEPQAGNIELGYQVSIGYYAQHVAESLDSKKTVIEEMTAKAHPEVSRQEGLNMAGSLLFSGDDIHKKISVLSGGEKSRVALGQILHQKAPCLILDEPTNHLDFQTVEALTQALTYYEGTLVVVSHDRSFIRRVGKKIVEINHGKASIYPGSYDEYIWSLEKGILSERAENSSTSAQIKSSIQKPIELPKESRKEVEQKKRLLEKTIERAEKKLATQQQKLDELNSLLASGLSGDDLQNKLVELQKLQTEIESLEKEWIQSSEELESLKNPLPSDI
jgi:ATP-binding cassette subfamily F protein 3